jgi:hypothetical protein
MAEDIQEFIAQQKLDKCVLIGHSMYVIRSSIKIRPGSNHSSNLSKVEKKKKKIINSNKGAPKPQ